MRQSSASGRRQQAHDADKSDDERAGGSEPTRNDVTIVVGRGVKHTFYIQDGRAGGAEYEAVDLADLCNAEWQSFLSAHQLDDGLNGFS